MDFEIAPGDALPIYRQIVDQLRRYVASGQCRPGDELPSVRALAQRHAINPMTVSKAYSLLEAEGVLERRRGMGMFIASPPAASGGGATRQQARLRLLEPALQAAANQAAQLDLTHAAAMKLFERCLRQQHPEGDRHE